MSSEQEFMTRLHFITFLRKRISLLEKILCLALPTSYTIRQIRVVPDDAKGRKKGKQGKDSRSHFPPLPLFPSHRAWKSEWDISVRFSRMIKRSENPPEEEFSLFL